MLTDGVVRSFNPIGQGSFVTEHFYQDGIEQASVVFDAGFLKTATKGGERRARRLIQSTLTKGVPISAIFVSHLDEDHVGLVPYILSEYRDQVKNVVLPRFSQETVFTYLFWYTVQGMAPIKGKKRWSSDLAQLITEVARKLRYVSGEEDVLLDQRRGPNWHLIRPHLGERPPPFQEEIADAIDLGQEGSDRAADRPSGGVFHLVGRSCRWYFVPYHREVKDDKRKAKQFWKWIIKNFRKCFQRGSYHPDEPFFSGDPDALVKLRWLSECVLRQESKYHQLAKIYNATWGDRNRDSMVVTSFPSRDCDIDPYLISPIGSVSFCVNAYLYEYGSAPFMPAFKPGAIYTGDSNAAELPLEILMGSPYVSYNIGSVQVPHHGSANSWDKQLVSANAILYFASYGSANIYGHPAPKVIRDITYGLKIPLFYNEYSLPYLQVFPYS